MTVIVSDISAIWTMKTYLERKIIAVYTQLWPFESIMYCIVITPCIPLISSDASSLRNKSYCILNKQYTKEEYEELVPKIIEHMMKPLPRSSTTPSSEGECEW